MIRFSTATTAIHANVLFKQLLLSIKCRSYNDANVSQNSIFGFDYQVFLVAIYVYGPVYLVPNDVSVNIHFGR